MVDSRSRKERFEAKTRRLKAKFLQEILVPQRIIIAIIPVALIFWFFGSIISLGRNWALQQEIIERQAELSYLNLQVDRYELENEYYASEEYQELAARRLQNKKLKGETLVYLPKNSEKARTKYKEPTNEQKEILNDKSNFDQWMQFLFGL